MAILSSTVLGQAADDGAATATEGESTAKLPKSGWDFSFYDSGNATFPTWAVGQNFVAHLSASADADEILRLEAVGGATISLSLRPLTNGTTPVESLRATTVKADGTKADFEGAWGAATHLRYETGLNGIKETVRFDERPGNGDLFVTAKVSFDADELIPQINGTNLTGYAHWSGNVVLVDNSGVERFRIPQAFVVDSGAANGGKPMLQWLEYQLERTGGALTVSAVVPGKYLDDSNVTWPIFVDPTITLPPQFSGQESYSDCDIYMESSLLLLADSSLTLDRCTMYFNGSYQLEVAPTATLLLRNSTVRSNSSSLEYGFFMNGTLVADHAAVLNTSNGVRTATFWDVTVNASTIARSSGDGLTVFGTPSSLFLNSTLIQNVSGAGLRIDTGGFLAPTINGTSVIGAAEGVAVGNTTVVAPLMNTTLTDIAGAAVHLDWGAAVFERLAVRNASEVFRAHNSTLNAGNTTARYAGRGTTCVDSSVYFDEVVVLKIDGIGFNATNCAATWLDGNYYAWARSLAASSIEVHHRLHVLVLNATDAPLSNAGVTFYDAQENADGPTIVTGADGVARNFLLKEFLLDADGDYTFYTPHRLEVGIGGAPSVHTYVGGPRTITIRATNDVDADGISNAVEDQWENVLWIEAEHLMRADGQGYADIRASNDTAVSASRDGRYFTELGWPPLQSGTYQLLVRSAGNGLGAALDLNVTLPNGTVLLPTERHQLPSDYTWVSARPFVVNESSRLIVNASSYVPANSTLATAEAVLIDKIALLRLKDGSGFSLGFTQGQRSDPLDNDTDFDGLFDGIEATSARAWFEAEVLAPAADTVSSPLAGSGLAIVHASGSATILSADLAAEGFMLASQATFQAYVRVRALQSGASNVTIQLSLGPSTSSGTYTVGAEWKWIAGPSGTVTQLPVPLVLAVFDDDDPNLSDSTSYIAVDQVAVLNVASLNLSDGWFNATSPLDPDLDRDGLPDGPELDGFFAADVIQAENYTSSDSVEARPAGIAFNNSAAWANYTVQVRYAGMYRFLVEPLFEVGEDAASMPYTVLKDLLIAEVRNANQALVMPALSAFPAFAYTNLSTNVGGMNQVGGFYDGRFNLSVGNYSFKVSIDLQKAATLSQQGRQFRIAFDQFYLQKYRLNATDWDRDGDLVPDGYEVNRSMLPLRMDSDYDVLDDFEEIHEGLDGFVTSPIRNDTDRDGILDPVEVGIAGDANNSTMTDPTHADSDRDGLPDGWIDGWTWLENASRYGRPSGVWWAKDGIRQPWEGEDLNADGARNDSEFELGGETDPNSADTDGDTMDDAWEVIPRGAWASPSILNPRINDSFGDPEDDDLDNFEEYSASTNPFLDDTDGDLIWDDDETRVFLRVSVADGAWNTSRYTNATVSDWIYYDKHPYDSSLGKSFSLANASVNLSAASGLAPNRTTWLKVLRDGGLILYNSTLEVVVVWDFDSDPFDVDENGILEGWAYEFHLNASANVESAGRPVIGYRTRELVGPVDPTVRDSDRDGNTDGNEGYWNGINATADWWMDYDGDQIAAAADADADGDGLPDGLENPTWDKTFEPEWGETAPYASDTDKDGIPDGNDSMPLDQDNDGLTGYWNHTPPGATILAFGGIEAVYGTDRTLPDTDGDLLLDGEEDANHNGTRDANETNARDSDTDDDGLWDGPLVRNGASNISVPVQSWMWPPGNVSNATVGTVNALSFEEPAWYVAEVVANYNLTNLTHKQYLVTANFTEPGPSTNVTRMLQARVDGKAWWQTRLMLNVTAPNWTTVVLGHILVPAGSYHILTVTADLGGFLIANLTLTPVNLSEGWFGTDPLHRDSDRDWLADGAEAGLNASLVTGGPGSLTATDTNNMTQNTNGFWSDPQDRDTDKDGLRDGGMDWNDTFYGESYYRTDPARADTDGDRLSDWTEVFATRSNATNPDTDGDWLPDSYEPLPTWDTDNDTLATIRDFDGDNNDTNPANWTRDYNSTGDGPGGNLSLTVVFRTNAARGQYWRAGTWVVVNVTGSDSLNPFVFDQNITSFPNYNPLSFKTHVRPEGDANGTQLWYSWPVKTFEGLEVLYDGTYVAIRVSATFGYRFHAWGPSDGPLPAVYAQLTLLNASASNYKYRETINWSALFIGMDEDRDGLNTAQEIANGTNVGLWDTDGDGLGDGAEVHGTFNALVGRTFRSNATVSDTDGDGLSDYTEIVGWGGGLASDPSDVDTDNDGAWDGWNTTGPSGMPNPTDWTLGEWRNGTNPLDLDTDGDGIPDGWELRYGFNGTNATDSISDPDWDFADNWQEYYWGQNETDDDWDGENETWVEAINGTWWNGTHPRELDTDNDTIPDGWEMYFGLNPKYQEDGPAHGDFDNLTNAQEYNWSIIAPWNVSRSWNPNISANPFLNDSDADGMNDDYELAGVRRDPDADGVPSAVDVDADGDELADWAEVMGWRVGVATAAAARQSLIRDENVSFVWSNVTSDPFDNDTDNDSLLDFQEYEESSDPRNSDTDSDGVNDSTDRVWDPVMQGLALVGGDPDAPFMLPQSTVQNLDPPTFVQRSQYEGSPVWDWVPWKYSTSSCSVSVAPLTFMAPALCVNISFVVEDENGVLSATFTNMGTGATVGAGTPLFGGRVNATPGTTAFDGWILVPLHGQSELDGQFQILVEAEDTLGNENTTIVYGGGTYEKWRNELAKLDVPSMEAVRGGGTCTFASGAITLQREECILGWGDDWGWHYGFDMAASGGIMGSKDTFDGYSEVWGAGDETPSCEVEDECAGGGLMGWLANFSLYLSNNTWACPTGSSVDLSNWPTFAQSVGLGLNPFEPTEDDLESLSDFFGTANLYCRARYDSANASNFALWMTGFFEGSKRGGMMYWLLEFVVTSFIPMGWIAKAGKALGGLLKGIATEAAAAGASRQVVIQTVVVAKAGAKAAGSTTELGQAVANRAGAVLRDSKGSLAQAVKTQDEVVRLVSKQADGALAAGENADIVIDAALIAKGRNIARLKEAFPALAADPKNIRAFEMAAEHGIKRNFPRFAEDLQKSEAFLKVLVDGGVPKGWIDDAFGLGRVRAGAHDLPAYAGGKTNGVLRIGDIEFPLISGKSGPAFAVPKGARGMNYFVKTHVEAHAAAQMGQSQAHEAILFINRVPCGVKPGCANNLPSMLPPNARLHVFGPDLYYQVFVGLP